MTREEIRAETDAMIDASVKAGNENKVDPFEIGLIHTVFRAYAHRLDDAQALDLDPDAVRKFTITMVANMFKIFMQRTIDVGDPFGAQQVGQETINKLAEFITADINAHFRAGKPN